MTLGFARISCGVPSASTLPMYSMTILSAVLIASSDLTHYEPASQAREKDTALLKHVQSLDLDAFYTAAPAP